MLRRPLDEEADFLWQSCLDESLKEVGAKPVPQEVLDERYGVDQWSCAPCFCVTQASGKKRRIDNAKKALHMLATAYTEVFTMNSAFTPGLVVKIPLREAEEQGCLREVG